MKKLEPLPLLLPLILAIVLFPLRLLWERLFGDYDALLRGKWDET